MEKEKSGSLFSFASSSASSSSFSSHAAQNFKETHDLHKTMSRGARKDKNIFPLQVCQRKQKKKKALESAVLGWLIDLVWFFVNYEEEREEKSLRKLGIRKLLILGFH